jgi:hypothetical protein
MVSYSPMIIRTYHIKSNKINNNIQLALITDLHGTIYGYKQENLIRKIKNSNVDAILFAGDIFDELHDFKCVEDLLEGLKDYQCYFALGNHEIRTERLDEIYSILIKYNIHIVSKQYETLSINNTIIDIYGIDDFNKYEDITEWETELKSLSNNINHYSILISHRPFLIDYYNETHFDLIVSGHAHGGQCRIPYLINGIFSPDEMMFPKYAGGLYQLNHSILIISRGLVRNLLPRFFNPPELVIIELQK